MPLRNKASSVVSSALAGPSVHMIFVFFKGKPHHDFGVIMGGAGDEFDPRGKSYGFFSMALMVSIAKR